MKKTYVNHQALDAVFRGSLHRGVALLVIESIARHVNERTGLSWPSQDLIAFEARASRSGVQLVIPKIQESGEIILARKGRGRNLTDQWRLNDELLERQAQERQKAYCLLASAEKHTRVADPIPEPVQKAAAKRVPARRKRQPETVWPAGFALDAEMRQIAVKAGMPSAEVKRQFALFEAHAQTHDRRAANWRGAWHQWALHYRPERQANGNGNGRHLSPGAENLRRNFLKAQAEEEAAGEVMPSAGGKLLN
ncbi:MAG: hypothetical protein ACLQU2_01205 [Candidatus Binataceae bacterium]